MVSTSVLPARASTSGEEVRMPAPVEAAFAGGCSDGYGFTHVAALRATRDRRSGRGIFRA